MELEGIAKLTEELKICNEQLPINNVLDVYAKQKARLKKDGFSVDDFDLLIGSTAIVNDIILVTNNVKHFNRLQNIKIENWISP